MESLREDRFTGCILGVAVGDALGQPVEAFPPDKRPDPAALRAGIDQRLERMARGGLLVG